MSKRKKDPDFVPTETDEDIPISKNKKPVSFLTQNQNIIWTLQQTGSGPTEIANSLCVRNGLARGSISGKQISNWLNCHKKAGIGKFRKVSLKNNNLQANDSDWYGDAVKIAKQANKDCIEEVEMGGDEEDSNLDETSIASKYVRFFTHSEHKVFALFVECGLDRIIKATPTSDHTAIELKVNIPLPSDKLFHKAGFKHAAKISFEKTKGTFIVEAPGRLQQHEKEIIYYPNKDTPIWIVFKYKMEEKKEEEVEVVVDLTEKLLHQS